MGPLSRREFLRHSAAYSSALAAAGITAAPRLSAAEEAAARKKVGANDLLRVAVVGVRGRGMSHVQGFAGRNGCEITTICDCDEAVIGKAMTETERRQKGKAPKFVQDIRKVVEDKDVDIVAIATPNHWHALAAIWAIQNGKDVYVEKPVSHNVWEGRQIVNAARRNKRICQTGTQIRSNPGMREAIAYLQSGKLGKLELARGLCYKRRGSIGKVEGPQSLPKSIDYDLWCGPAAKTPLMRKNLHYDWHWIWEYGNGDLGNQGIHQMDVARWGLGQDKLANAVVSFGGRFGYVDDGQTANTQVATFDYGGPNLIFEVRGLETEDYLSDVRNQPTKNKQMQAKVGNVFQCADGYLITGSYDSAVACTKDWEPVKVFSRGGDHFENFLKAVRSRNHEDLHADILEGHLSSALCHLANISYRLGTEKPLSIDFAAVTEDPATLETVKRMKEHLEANKVPLKETMCQVGPRLAFDPQAERFTGNSKEANAMLSREYRKGFEVTANA